MSFPGGARRSARCPVCGAAGAACGPHAPLDKPIITHPLKEKSVANEQRIYLPQQRVRRGVAGYKNLRPGTVVVAPDAIPGAPNAKAIVGQRGR